METITSPHNPRFKTALRLHTSRGRQQQNRIIVFGQREVSRALQAGIKFEEFWLSEENASSIIAALRREMPASNSNADSQTNGKQNNEKIYNVPTALFEKLAYGQRDSAILGIAPRPNTDLQNLKSADQSLLIVLESLEKPGNLGAIARSADGSGVNGLLIADPLTDIFHPNAIRSSVATVFSVPLATGSSREIHQWLTANGYRILIATPEAEKNLYATDLTGRVAIVFGNEAKGLSETWRKSLHQGVQLPMSGTADSLNVSVTASLMMYERYRQSVS